MSHVCHADNCTKPVAPKMFMCLSHWRMVPRDVQQNIWKHYRPGQERDKRPTIEYLKWTRLARCYVNFKEQGLTEKEISEWIQENKAKYPHMIP